MNKIYVVLAICVLLYIFSDSDKVDMHASDVDANCSVVMFTADWCPVCKTAKRYFKNNNYSYCEFDVEKDSFANHYYQELETNGVPTILIGNRITVGFYPDEIDDLISDLDE
jgi:glutaredoxin